jgi:hypothetical protein
VFNARVVDTNPRLKDDVITPTASDATVKK